MILSIFTKKSNSNSRDLSDKLMTSHVMSAKEIRSNSLVMTELPEKFYGEVVCTWIITVHIYWLVICILNKSIWQTEDNCR